MGDAAFRDALAAAIAAVEARDSAQETAHLPVVAQEGEKAALAPGSLADEFAGAAVSSAAEFSEEHSGPLGDRRPRIVPSSHVPQATGTESG
jgi:hypothetical protein